MHSLSQCELALCASTEGHSLSGPEEAAALWDPTHDHWETGLVLLWDLWAT